MTPWKSILVLLLALMPGGFLVLLAMATAKAFRASFEQLLGSNLVPARVRVSTRNRRG